MQKQRVSIPYEVMQLLWDAGPDFHLNIRIEGVLHKFNYEGVKNILDTEVIPEKRNGRLWFSIPVM